MKYQKQKIPSRTFRRAAAAARRGFSLVEVLLAMFILGIGMVMVASVFPVGANWTRQTVEDSTAQTVVQNALSVIRTHYGTGGNLRGYLNADYLVDSGTNLVPNTNNFNSILNTQDNYMGWPAQMPFVLQALPGFLNIPPSERAYQFGSSTPFPAKDWTQCTYFWTALARLSPTHQNYGWNRLKANMSSPVDYTNGISPSSSYNYDIYILVFRKGSFEQKFTRGGPSGHEVEILGLRSSNLMPSVYTSRSYERGTYQNGVWTSWPPFPPVGQTGIGLLSGTVFRQVLDPPVGSPQPWSATARPAIIYDPTRGAIMAYEPIIFFPAADGTADTASPLIYIYQTTMTF